MTRQWFILKVFATCLIMAKAAWNKLPNLPKADFGDVTNLNHAELVLVTLNKAYKYNYIKNEWKLWIEHNRALKYEKIAYNKSNHKLYCSGTGGYGRMMIIDTKTENIEQFSPTFDVYDNQYPNLVNVGQDIHVIGGSQCSKHFIWNDESKELDEIFDFSTIENEAIKGVGDEDGNIVMETHSISLSGSDEDFLSGSCLIYVSSQDLLLIFGGPLKNIHQFSLATNTWTVWNDKLDCSFSYGIAVLTNDERYVIIVGSFGSDEIYVLDLRQELLKKSAIRCPESGSHLAAISSNIQMDDLMVNGYIRFIHDEVPPEIVGLILKYYTVEMLHWMAYKKSTIPRGHYMIPVNDIIKFCI